MLQNSRGRNQKFNFLKEKSKSVRYTNSSKPLLIKTISLSVDNVPSVDTVINDVPITPPNTPVISKEIANAIVMKEETKVEYENIYKTNVEATNISQSIGDREKELYLNSLRKWRGIKKTNRI